MIGIRGVACLSAATGAETKPARTRQVESRTPAVLRSDVTYLTLVVMMERRETRMSWTTPTLVEICIGLEINGYLPAEF